MYWLWRYTLYPDNSALHRNSHYVIRLPRSACHNSKLCWVLSLLLGHVSLICYLEPVWLHILGRRYRMISLILKLAGNWDLWCHISLESRLLTDASKEVRTFALRDGMFLSDGSASQFKKKQMIFKHLPCTRFWTLFWMALLCNKPWEQTGRWFKWGNGGC